MKKNSVQILFAVLGISLLNPAYGGEHQTGQVDQTARISQEESSSSEETPIRRDLEVAQPVNDHRTSCWQNLRQNIGTKNFWLETACFTAAVVFEAAGIGMVYDAVHSGKMEWKTPNCSDWTCQGRRTEFGFGLVGIIAGPFFAGLGIFCP